MGSCLKLQSKGKKKESKIQRRLIKQHQYKRCPPAAQRDETRPKGSNQPGKRGREDDCHKESETRTPEVAGAGAEEAPVKVGRAARLSQSQRHKGMQGIAPPIKSKVRLTRLCRSPNSADARKGMGRIVTKREKDEGRKKAAVGGTFQRRTMDRISAKLARRGWNDIYIQDHRADHDLEGCSSKVEPNAKCHAPILRAWRELRKVNRLRGGNKQRKWKLTSPPPTASS